MAKVQFVESDEREGERSLSREWTPAILLLFAAFNWVVDSGSVPRPHSEIGRIAGPLTNERAGQGSGCFGPHKKCQQVRCLARADSRSIQPAFECGDG